MNLKTKSWKTTIMGIITGLMMILPQLKAAIDSNPETVFNLDLVLAGLTAMGIGWFARDNNRSSHQVGAGVLALLATVMMVGCAGGLSKPQMYMMLSDDYATANNTMELLSQAGLVDLATLETYEQYRAPAGVLFDSWEDAIREGTPFNGVKRIQQLLDQMILIYIQYKEQGNGTKRISGGDGGERGGSARRAGGADDGPGRAGEPGLDARGGRPVPGGDGRGARTAEGIGEGLPSRTRKAA